MLLCQSSCDILVPRQYSHIFRCPLGFLYLDLFSCPCFIFNFIFFIIRQLFLHQSRACQIACWCLEDLWTKQTKVLVFMEFVGSKSWFCTKYLYKKNFCWNQTIPVNHVVSGNSSYKFKGKQLPWRPCDLLPAEPKATLYKNGLLACLLHLQIDWAYNLRAHNSFSSPHLKTYSWMNR